MTNLSAFNQFTSALKEDGNIMPVLFIGHGSPMNGIEENEFTENWRKMAASVPEPKAVLVISAHWLTRGTHITAMEKPRTIHDFGGFPEELFKVQYPAPGDPVLARETAGIIQSTEVGLDHEWGLDHGTWTVVRHMFPDAKIPVLQLSIDYAKGPQYHYDLAKELLSLRKRGVLIIGSGNMVHNLRMVAWEKLNDLDYGYDWAIGMNEQFKKNITSGSHDLLINYESMGKEAMLAIPTPDHYYPLMYILGLQQKNDAVEIFNDRLVGGSLTMTSVKFGV
jgi:4,5-DOPA dioxygenase extradiol